MRKLIIIVMACVLLTCSCATVQQSVCNPPQSVINVVVAAVPLIQVAIEMAIPGSQQYIDALGAEAVANYILSGACVTAEQIDKLIGFLKSFNKTAKATAVDNKMIQVLENWRDGK